MLGLSFKSNTDDLRESPFVDLAQKLIGQGYDLKIYDKNVEYARINGSNKEYINSHIPHISRLLVSDLDEALAHGDSIVVSNGSKEFSAIFENLPEGKKVIDLHGFMEDVTCENKIGICW
jgi:GDP-mannose 6-dehydrogenase